MRSKDGFLPAVECGALLRALKISTRHAQTLPYGSTPSLMSFGLPSLCKAVSTVKSTNPHFDFQENLMRLLNF